MSHYIRKDIVNRTENELLSYVKSARLLFEHTISDLNEQEIIHLADEISSALSQRVTIIQADGKVVGDSDLTEQQLYSVDNHENRVEVKAALLSEFGTATRYSTTIGSDLMYAAASFKIKDEVFVIRISKSLTAVSDAVHSLMRILFFASVIGLFIAALMSVVISHFFSRRLRSLVFSAKQLVIGEGRHRIKDDVQDEIGGLAGSLNALSDKLEEYVAQLAEKRDQFEAVLDGMSEAVIATDEKGQVTLINRAGAVLLGLTDCPSGRMLLETVRIPALYELVSSVQEPHGAHTREFDLPIESPRRILARATRLLNGGVVIVLLDVTDLRKLERIRRDFVSNVSHELRTPISIIKANAETLRDGALADQEVAERFLDAMINNAERLSCLISDLLDISRIEEGKLEFVTNPVSIEKVLNSAASALKTKASERQFTIEIEPCSRIFVLADERTLEQILFNLIDNAVKYSGIGGRVVMRAIDNEDNVLIEVEDNGPGIDSRYRDRLFERFFRIDKGRSRDMGGTGLGLAIVKHLVIAMKGEVGMKPAKPNGSIFWVLLPKP